ncbi:MAG: hypothetical protein ACRDKI_01080 [Solirubrobacterales bacterium]
MDITTPINVIPLHAREQPESFDSVAFEPGAAFGVAVAPARLGNAVARPSDHRRPWQVADAAFLKSLKEAATCHRMTETAVASIALEYSLLVAETSTWCSAEILLSRCEGELDLPIHGRLSPTSSAYLRSLLYGSQAISIDAGAETCLNLPIRLTDRADDPIAVIAGFDFLTLPLAISWETAAAAQGLTMTEWAFRALARS